MLSIEDSCLFNNCQSSPLHGCIQKRSLSSCKQVLLKLPSLCTQAFFKTTL